MNDSELRKNPIPWMTKGAIGFIAANLKPTDTVIEFGGGWSSLWWAARAKFTLTIESSPEWASKLIMEAANRPELLTKWTLKFVASDWNPDHNKLRKYWKEHKSVLTPEAILAMNERYLAIDFEPDVIVIDGAIRPTNIYRVNEFLKTNKKTNMIVVDNMESLAPYTEGKFTDFTRHDFHETNIQLIPPSQNGKWCTSVWLRK